MYIAGLGIIFSGGRGIISFEEALENRNPNPSSLSKKVSTQVLIDKIVLKEARRADDFTKMAVLAANDAFVDSGLNQEAKKSLGVIVATAFGPHVTTFRFLDDILTYGDKGVSPTLFSHSVHNAAASYIASNLESRGPTLTLTQFKNSFYQAIIIAQCWLKEKRCENVLIGGLDQLGKEMEYILNLKAKEIMPQEGSAFFLATENKDLNKYCSVSIDVAKTNQLFDTTVNSFDLVKSVLLAKNDKAKTNKIISF